MAVKTSYIRCQRPDKTSTFKGAVKIEQDLAIDGNMNFGNALTDTLSVSGVATFHNTITVGTGAGDAHNVQLYGSTSAKYFLWKHASDAVVLFGDMLQTGTTTKTGNTQLNGTLTIGSTSAKYDAKLYGSTSTKFFIWDSSEDQLKVSGATTLLTGALSVGVTGGGTQHDVTLYGSTDARFWKWDNSADEMLVSGTTVLTNSLTVGRASGTGFNVKALGTDSTNFFLWDAAADKATINGALRASGTTEVLGTLSVGVTGGTTQHDVTVYGSTDDRFWKWDNSTDEMLVSGTTVLTNSLTVGRATGTGHNIRAFGTDSTSFFYWDASADKTTINGELKASGATEIFGALTIGATGGGTQHDITIYGSTDDRFWKWDNSEDEMIVSGTTVLTNSLTVGRASGTGFDIQAFGTNSTRYFQWDASADRVMIPANTEIHFQNSGVSIGATTEDEMDIDASSRINMASNCKKVYIGGLSKVSYLYFFDNTESKMMKTTLDGSAWVVSVA